MKLHLLKNKNMESKISFLLLSFNFIYLTVITFLIRIGKIHYNIYRYSTVVVSLICLFFCIVCFFLSFLKKKKNPFIITDYIVFGIIIFAVISCVFAIDQKVSLFGQGGRYEGFFAILYYISLYLLATFVSKDKKKYLIYFFLFLGFIQSIYSFLQIEHSHFVSISYHFGDTWATGFLFNPNFFAELIILCLAYAMGFLLEEEKSKCRKIIFIILFCVYFSALAISNTLSCFVGFLFILFYSFLYGFIRKRKIPCFLMLLLGMFLLLFYSIRNQTTLLGDFHKTSGEVQNIVGGNLDSNYGTKRLGVWMETIKIVPKYLLHGSGIDNFDQAFGEKHLIVGHYRFDKAHNDYLQILVTQGIFSLLCFLSLFFIICVRGVFLTYKNHEIYFLLPVIGYLVQIFFNISVVEVAPLFYVSLGLLDTRDTCKIREICMGFKELKKGFLLWKK